MSRRPNKKKRATRGKSSGRRGCRWITFMALLIPSVGGIVALFFQNELWLKAFMPAQLENYRLELTRSLGAQARPEVDHVFIQAEEFLLQKVISVSSFEEVISRYDHYQEDGRLSKEEAREILDYAKRIVEQAERVR